MLQLRRQLSVAVLVICSTWAGFASAQPEQPAPPPDQPVPEPAPEPVPEPAPEPAPTQPTTLPEQPSPTPQGLRIHFVSTQRTYVAIEYDIFSIATGKLVGDGRGAIESRGEEVDVWELPPGLYKIVKHGEPFETKVDFVTASVGDGAVTDFVVIVDTDSGYFRGGGPVTDELPEGVDIAGIRVALNGGGNLMFNQKFNSVGTTSGINANVGLFGNFGLIVDKGNHFLDVSADLALNLTDPSRGTTFSTSDVFQANATYTYKINNPYIGPYLRGGFRTRVSPGYLYFADDAPVIIVDIARVDGTTDTVMLGTAADPDSLRVKVAKPFAPFQLQEEIGANLKAVDLDLLLLKLVVGTRIGYGFRQGLTNELLVVDGDDEGNRINLTEVDDYFTSGPVVGASAKVTIARWLFGSANFGVMAPVQDTDRAGDGFGDRLMMDLSGTAGLKIPALTRFLFASFDYTFRLEKDGYLTSETQFDHSLMARVNVTLF